MNDEQEVVVLRSFGYRHEGEFARSTLDAAGIPSVLIVDDAGGAQVGLSFSNPARLLVRREHLDEARALLEQELAD
jgi:hypothetical protein